MGILLLVGGVLCLEWVVPLWAGDAFLEARPRRNAFRILSASGLLFGSVFVLLRGTIAAHLVPLLAVGVTLATMLGLFLAADVFIAYRSMYSPKVEKPTSFIMLDDRLGWKPRPGAERTSKGSPQRNDADGLRHIPYDGTPERRLWIFGDSYTFGAGVGDGEAWPAVVARRYLDARVQVMNTGVGGYGVIQQYGRLQEFSERIQPGDIVLFSPITRDLDRNVHIFIKVSSHLFRADGHRQHFPVWEDGDFRGVPIYSRWNLVRGLFLNAFISEGVFRLVARAVAGTRPIDEAHEVFDAARALAAERGAAFALIFLPQVKELQQEHYRLDLSSFDFVDIRRHFPADRDELRALRFEDDAHWNPSGHEVAARAVLAGLLESGVLDPADLQPGVADTFASP